MKTLLSILFFFLFMVYGFSQFGYRGKTVYVDYSQYSSIALAAPTYSGTKEDNIGINRTHELALHKTYGRTKEIIGFYNFSKTSFYLPVSSYLPHEDGNYDDFYYDPWDDDAVYVDYSLSSPYKLKTHTFGASFRFYVKNVMPYSSNEKWHIAPIGPYVDIKPYYSVLVKHLATYKIENGEIVENGTNKIGNISTAGLAIGLGKQRVFLDRFTFGYGAQMSLPFRIKDVPFFDETSPIETKIDNKAITRLFIKSFFEVKLSIGVLAF